MKLEQQVTSLEISKRLKELGVNQESYFYWITFGQEPEIIRPNYLIEKNGQEDMYSAYSSAELGEMLPKRIQGMLEKGGATIHYFSQHYTALDFVFIKYTDSEGFNLISVHGDTEADARGKCLIYLIENNLIELK